MDIKKIMEGTSLEKIQKEISLLGAGGAIDTMGEKMAITSKQKERDTDSNFDSMSSQTPAAKMLLGIGVIVKARHLCVCAHAFVHKWV